MRPNPRRIAEQLSLRGGKYSTECFGSDNCESIRSRMRVTPTKKHAQQAMCITLVRSMQVYYIKYCLKETVCGIAGIR